MKFIKFLLIALSLFTLTACLSGGSGPKSGVDDDTRIMDSLTVSEDGTVSYIGLGEFEGFELEAVVPSLAGRTLYIEKSDSDYFLDGYISVSSKFSVRLTDEASETDSYGVYTADITIPYSASLLTAEDGSSGDIEICANADGSVLAFETAAGEGTYVSGTVSFPYDFFAGISTESGEDDDDVTGIIQLKGKSYKDASDDMEFLRDHEGVDMPDVIRGTRRVQPGERVLLGINWPKFGEEVSTDVWELYSVPAGSASILAPDGDYQTFTPDMPGIYKVSVRVTGINGKIQDDRLEIYALNYSYNAAVSGASCALCHDGSFASPDGADEYDRITLRDMVTPWSASAHGSAFTPIAASTDTSCFQCHTTGFFYADRDSDGTDEYSAASGYDDSIADWNNPATSGDDHLKGVTCEACHGPYEATGVSFTETHFFSAPLSSEVCLTCHEHEGVSGHFFEFSTAHENAHTLAGGNVVKNAECFTCHSAEGVMSKIYDAGITMTESETVTGIGCAVCHDPHGESGNNAQLRISGDYEIELTTGTYTADAGDGLICYQCHNADTTLPAVGTILHNSQAEMIQGVGGYTYGTGVNGEQARHIELGMTCNDCHMSREEGTTHNMLMTEDGDARVEACKDACHSISSLVYEDGYYDMGGQTADVRAMLEELREKINEKAGLPAGSNISASYSAGTDALEEALNNAAYNYNFIISDKSNGFHNPDYAEALIQLSLSDLNNY